MDLLPDYYPTFFRRIPGEQIPQAAENRLTTSQETTRTIESDSEVYSVVRHRRFEIASRSAVLSTTGNIPAWERSAWQSYALLSILLVVEILILSVGEVETITPGNTNLHVVPIRVRVLQRIVPTVAIQVEALRIVLVKACKGFVWAGESALGTGHVACLEPVQPGFAIPFFAGKLVAIDIRRTRVDTIAVARSTAADRAGQLFAKRQVINPLLWRVERIHVENKARVSQRVANQETSTRGPAWN